MISPRLRSRISGAYTFVNYESGCSALSPVGSSAFPFLLPSPVFRMRELREQVEDGA